jgi:hypothetical protein
MPPTEVIESHREPTRPPMIPRHFGEGQGLPDLALVAQTTGPVVPFDDTRLNDRVQGVRLNHTIFAWEEKLTLVADCIPL